MSLFAAIIRPDVGSIPHTEYLVDIFSTQSVYSNLGLKALLLEESDEKVSSAHAQLEGLD